MKADELSPRSRLGYGVAGLAIIAVLAVLLVVGVFPSYSGARYYTATFARAGQGLDHQSDVKIRGITVGGVDSVHLDPDGRARVRFRVDNGVKIPTTAVVSVEPASVFGPKDIDIDLGSGEGAGPYFADNAQIKQTRDPQELSDTAWPLYRLTGAINPEEVSALVHTFSQGLQGEGPALHRTVGNFSTPARAPSSRRSPTSASSPRPSAAGATRSPGSPPTSTRSHRRSPTTPRRPRSGWTRSAVPPTGCTAT
jgi:phospholipid/cholesterol/gamma-HCH transport system substrate-binding protein